MTLAEISLYSGGTLLLLMTFVQISPIKINPWSWLGRVIGRAINGEVIAKVDALSEDVAKNKVDDDDKWASLSRSHILAFGDEIRLGINHSQERFDQILLDIADYKKYCDDHPNYLNDKAPVTIALIERTYQKCLEENNFL